MPKNKEARHILPREEWPYEVPGNWLWIKLEDIASNMADGPFGSNLKREHYTENREVRIIQLSNIGEENNWRDDNVKYTTFEHAKEIIRSMVLPRDIVIAKMMPAGRAILCPNDEKGYVLSSDAVKLVPINEVDRGFLMWEINSPYFQKLVHGNTQGITRARTSIRKLKSYPIAIPPLPEQQRIVALIESLFAKLDAAEGRIKDALEKSERLRASVLHLAFTGELTKKWREDHGVNMESWQNRRVDSFCKSLQYGTSQKSQKAGAVIVLRMGNLRDGEIDWSNLVYTDNADDIKKYKLDCGDVLFNRTNSAEHVGKTSIYRGEYPAIYAGYLIKLDYNRDEVIGDYLNFALNSSQARAYCKKVKSDGVNQSNINAKKIGAYEMPIPTLQEQQEIVLILNTIFDSQKRVKEIAEQNLVRIARMKKSLLSLAFRGQIGTNNPVEESMESVLLASS